MSGIPPFTARHDTRINREMAVTLGTEDETITAALCDFAAVDG